MSQNLHETTYVKGFKDGLAANKRWLQGKEFIDPNLEPQYIKILQEYNLVCKHKKDS